MIGADSINPISDPLDPVPPDHQLHASSGAEE